MNAPRSPNNWLTCHSCSNEENISQTRDWHVEYNHRDPSRGLIEEWYCRICHIEYRLEQLEQKTEGLD